MLFQSIILAAMVINAKAIRCFTCDRSNSNAECNQNGMAECNLDSCISQIKTKSDNKTEVTKFCSSSLFCHHLSKSECDDMTLTTGTCFKCCKSDGCNRNVNTQIKESCPIPSFKTARMKTIRSSPNNIVVMMDIARAVTDDGWMIVIVFKQPLPDDVAVNVYGRSQNVLGFFANKRVVAITSNKPFEILNEIAIKYFIVAFKGDLSTEMYETAKIGYLHQQNVSNKCIDEYEFYYDMIEIQNDAFWQTAIPPIAPQAPPTTTTTAAPLTSTITEVQPATATTMTSTRTIGTTIAALPITTTTKTLPTTTITATLATTTTTEAPHTITTTKTSHTATITESPYTTTTTETNATTTTTAVLPTTTTIEALTTTAALSTTTTTEALPTTTTTEAPPTTTTTETNSTTTTTETNSTATTNEDPSTTTTTETPNTTTTTGALPTTTTTEALLTTTTTKTPNTTDVPEYFQFLLEKLEYCNNLQYSVINPGYAGRDGKWRFSFRIMGNIELLKTWNLYLYLQEDITAAFMFKMTRLPITNLNKIFVFKPSGRYRGKPDFTAVGVATLNKDLGEIDLRFSENFPQGTAVACGRKRQKSVFGASIPTKTSVLRHTLPNQIPMTTMPPRTTTGTPFVFNISSRCEGPSGVLPNQAINADPTMFKPSSPQDMVVSKYDYNKLLHLSLLFYESQRSGVLPEDNRIPWRGHSGLQDGCDVGVNLVGGYFDAGDHVKFGFPMAATVTVIAWGMIEFRDAYVDANEWGNALDMIKWGTDYFIKAHASAYELYVQVGNGKADHEYWGHAETMDMKRPAMKIDKEHPGSEVAAETAAALAASSILFRNVDLEYSKLLLKHASQLFHFAHKHRGNYHESIPGVKEFYRSWSGFEDELVWAALWLYKASNIDAYLRFAEQLAYMINGGEFSWDQKGPGVLALLTQIYPDKYSKNLQDGISQTMNRRMTPAGLTFFMEWGPNRYAANYAFICLVAAKIFEGEAIADKYLEYAESQIHNMLGSGDNERSYVVGFGRNPPQRPHHRSSSCEPWARYDEAPCTFDDLNKSTPNKIVLYGALVGGPTVEGDYEDDRKDYKLNEVAMDYNAGFQSAIAGLKYFVMRKR